MDDTNQVQQQNPPPPIADVNVVNPPVQNVQPVASSQPQVATPQVPLPPQPITPGGIHKERQVGGMGPITEPSELITPSETEPQVPQEVADVGVEKVSEKLQLLEEHKNAGLDYAKESVPVATQPTGIVQLPMTEEEALLTIKTAKKNDSKYGEAVLIERVYQWFRELHRKIVNT